MGLATPSTAAAAPTPKVGPAFTIQKLAPAPRGVTNCDDLAYLDGHLFMGCQNAAQSGGGGGNSTIVEYGGDGSVINTWSVADKADGLAGDPLHHRVIVTLNEDAHSHLATITPSAPAGQQVANYHYSVDPGNANVNGPLHTGGGTDAISVDARGHIYLSGSYGVAKTGTAVFKVTLTPPSAGGATGLATLAPTFLDNATATNGNTGRGTETMKLIDVDSNALVPYTSPRYGGDFVIDDQTALALVFSSNIDAGTGLTEVHTSYGLDDIRWATTNGGTLYIVDKGPTASAHAHSILYKVTGPFVAGTAYASSDSIPDQVVTVDLKNGKTTPFVHGLQTAKGLVYLDGSGNEPVLASGTATGAAAAATTATTSTTAAAATTTRVASVVKPSSDSDALAMVLAIAALVIATGLGAFSLLRGRTAPA